MGTDAQSGSPVNYDASNPVLHVVVVGFHHKKGCQVEYAHPPLIPGGESSSSELPSQWRNLPSLALPDGSHNWDEDTVYFHLPALHNPRKTVFGISCYRQIDVEKIKNKTSDITRGTVQKSVCVLSRLPLFGQIQVKMSLITAAYFQEGDFSNVSLIKLTYENLSECLTDDMVYTQQLYVGLSARDFVLHFRQRALVLFKLLLLERKVLFFKSPVRELSSHILTLLSLLPGMLESGLDSAACMVPPDTPGHTPEHSRSPEPPAPTPPPSLTTSDSLTNLSTKVKDRLSGALTYMSGSKSEQNIAGHAQDTEAEESGDPRPPPAPSFTEVCALSLSSLGMPLRLWEGGNLCHPYLSLPYLDILQQPSIHGYVIGATNALFKTKACLSDLVIDIDSDRLEVTDPDLRKALALTTEDLRFIEGVVRVVGSDDHKGEFLEGVGWEGGDEWVRARFRFYLASLLRTSLLGADSPEAGLYNREYMQQLGRTVWHRSWAGAPPQGVLGLPPGHPSQGGSSVTEDVRLRFNHTISNTEGGKRVSAAVTNTSRAVHEGLSQAKGALSSWWGGLGQGGRQKEEEGVREEQGQENGEQI